jgi:hypothetical protein
MGNQLSDDGSHVFILRLWREPGIDTDAAPEWRALIENVSTSTRHPIKDMTALQALLAPFEEDSELDNLTES